MLSKLGKLLRCNHSFFVVCDLLRLDPLVDGGALEAPVGADLEAGQLTFGSVLVDRQRLHAKVVGELLDGKNAFFSVQCVFLRSSCLMWLVE